VAIVDEFAIGNAAILVDRDCVEVSLHVPALDTEQTFLKQNW
jgi:hypothetical protein